MDEYGEIQVVNPKRRRRRGGPRKMSALQRMYFGKGHSAPKRRRTRRNPPVMARRRRSHKAWNYVTHHMRRTNPVGNIIGNAMDVVKDGAVGAVGIVVNNMAGNTAANLLKVTDPLYRRATKVGTAVLLPTLVGMVLPQFRGLAKVAAATAIAHEISKTLDEKVFPTLGQVGQLMSSYDGVPVVTADTVTPSQKGRYGYLPGARYIGPVGYLPGAQYVEQGPFASRVM